MREREPVSKFDARHERSVERWHGQADKPESGRLRVAAGDADARAVRVDILHAEVEIGGGGRRHRVGAKGDIESVGSFAHAAIRTSLRRSLPRFAIVWR